MAERMALGRGGAGGTWRGQASREQAVQANQACQTLACACHQPALGTSTWAGRQGKTAEKAGRAVDCCGLKRITSQVWSGWRRHGTLELWKAKANSTAHRPCTNRLYTGASHARPCVHACPGTEVLEHVPGCYWHACMEYLGLVARPLSSNVAGGHLGPAIGSRALNSRHARHRRCNHD